MCNTNSPHLCIKIGNNYPAQVSSLQSIKDAMVQTMIHRWEAGIATTDDECFSVCTGIYHEANALLYLLSQNLT